jgi:hypothetical protein
MQRRTSVTLQEIFLTAVAIRWLYDTVLFATMGTPGLTGADSRGYLGNAEIMAAAILRGDVHGWGWLGTDLGIMPLYPWLVTLNTLMFGGLAPLATVLIQGVIDGATCVLVYRIAAAIDLRIAMPAAIAAVVNPTQIVLSGLVYNDTLFVFCVALFLAGTVHWLRDPSWKAPLVAGVGLGLAALDRIVIAPWVAIMAVALLAIRACTGNGLRARHAIQVAAMVVLFGLCIAPVLNRNVTQYGAWALTNQGGSHLALWVAPLVRQAKDGTPWERGSAEIESRARERFGTAAQNPFVASQQYAELGREELAKLGFGAVLKAWATGAAINLASPAIILSPPVAKLPRTGFYATPGRSPLEQIGNFLFHSDNAVYAWALLLGIAGVAVCRLLQLGGLVALGLDRGVWPATILLLLWAAFILAANGPVASPKYRLPIEPVLCVLTGAGVALLRRGRRRAVTAPHTDAQTSPPPARA